MNKWCHLLLIIALTMMWSPSFLFIKLAVTEISPLAIITIKTAIAALIFYSLLYWKGHHFPRQLNFWFNSLVMAIFASVLPFYLFCCAEQAIESAMAAMINGTTPMFTALLANLFIPTDRLSFKKLGGISVSLVGLLFLFLPGLLEAQSSTIEGMIIATLAAFCYAASHVYAKKHQVGYPLFVAPTAELICSCIILTPFALLYENPSSFFLPSLQAIVGLAGLILLGTVLAYIIYYKLLDYCAPTAISMVSVFFPVCGIALGFIFLGESFSWQALLASLLIFSGLILVNEIPIFRSLSTDSIYPTKLSND